MYLVNGKEIFEREPEAQQRAAGIHARTGVVVAVEKLEPRALIGRRVEIPVHYDLWMRGARYGVVSSFKPGGAGISDCLRVRMDNPRVKRRCKVWRLDWPYMKLV